VLATAGDLLIINFSYRGDPARDRADVDSLAQAFGLEILRAGTREFSLWDGLTFHLSKTDKGQ
jgi:hypothetical protein